MIFRTRFGFTLIELVLVVFLVGILAASVLPKLDIVNSGYNEITYRDRLISLLRLQQNRAMQQTNSTCHLVRLAGNAFGIPFKNNAISCESDAVILDDYEELTSHETGHYGLSLVERDNGVIFSGLDVYFNNLGCPVTTAGSACGSVDYLIQIVGQDTYQVCIESQGYIHVGACN